jgi:hypothetical protein
MNLMVAGIPWINLLWISSCIQFQFVSIVPKYLNFAGFSKNLLSLYCYFILHTSDWTSTVFTSGPVCLLVSIRTSVFFFMVFMLHPNKLSLSWTKSSFTFCINSTWFSWTFLIAYSREKLKSIGHEASCFRPLWTQNTDQHLPKRTLLLVSSNNISNGRTSYIGTASVIHKQGAATVIGETETSIFLSIFACICSHLCSAKGTTQQSITIYRIILYRLWLNQSQNP